MSPAKDLYEQYVVIPCVTTGAMTWTTAQPVSRSTAAKVGYALCDTVGSQTIEIIRYVPDDIYIDNSEALYAETRGLVDIDHEGLGARFPSSIGCAWGLCCCPVDA